MTYTQTPPAPTTNGRTVRDDIEVYDDTEKGSGWLFFAGTMLGLAGLMRIIDSIWAFGYSGTMNLKDGVLGSSLHTYAWTWLIVGTVLVVSSFYVLVRAQFARWVGMIAAVVIGLTAMTWMPFYPVWSLTYVAIAMFVLYALAAHGGKEPR